jgi:hypothetical protein
MQLRICNVCSLRHITKSSAVWCSECDEGFCTDCKEYHNLAKATGDHVTITIGEYQKLPPFIIGITPLCDEHREKYQTYYGILYNQYKNLHHIQSTRLLMIW